MDGLEGIMLSEISHTDLMKSLICGIEKYIKLVNIAKKKQKHRFREQSSGYE